MDDILTVPFSPEELVARMLVILRRTYHETDVFTPVLRLGDLENLVDRHVRNLRVKRCFLSSWWRLWPQTV